MSKKSLEYWSFIIVLNTHTNIHLYEYIIMHIDKYMQKHIKRHAAIYKTKK